MGPGTFKLLFLGLMGSGLPVALAMAGASLVYVIVDGKTPDYVVIHRMVGGLDSFPLLAVPFFILAGNLMNSAGITNRIYNFALALVGWMRGGLGHVNVLGSVIFAGMSGTAIADAAGLGTIEIKAMTEHGYSKEFSVGVTGRLATLGPIIPPSLPVRDLRALRQRLGGRALPRRDPAGRGDGDPHDVHGRLLRAQEQMGARTCRSIGRACCKAFGEL
jgi:TRAP-type mannitol/chloroaromatic compound transport system permease large subunit